MIDTRKKRFGLLNNFDVVMARQHAREMAREMGFGLTDQTRIATAVSEVSRRALANQGEISFLIAVDGSRQGIECVCLGCEWVESSAGRPTGEILGGMRGVERLMDDFHTETLTDGQNKVLMRKWLKADASA